jgi:hypothetical protein
MIYVTRTASIAPGKGVAAFTFAQKASDYWRTTWDRNLEVRRPIGGNPNRIAWVGQYKDLAEFEAVTTKSLADPKYLELLVSAGELFIAGSIHDDIWRTA